MPPYLVPNLLLLALWIEMAIVGNLRPNYKFWDENARASICSTTSVLASA